MAAKKRVISFEDWIEKKGVDVLARYLGVDRATINHWRAGRCDPRVDHMRRLKRYSRGELGYDQMIDRPMQGGRS